MSLMVSTLRTPGAFLAIFGAAVFISEILSRVIYTVHPKTDCEKMSKLDKNEPEPEQPNGADAYVIYENPDKKFKRRLGPQEYMPHVTSRILLSGPPGSGKRNLILNIVYRCDPPPSMIHIVHIDPHTVEYDDLTRLKVPILMWSPDNFPTMEGILDGETEEDGGENAADEPAPEDDASASEEVSDSDTQIEKVGSPMVIVDEITSSQLNKLGRERFERMVNYVITHSDSTLICSIQSLMSIPADARRGFNVFNLWPQKDDTLNKLVAKKVGIDIEFLSDLFRLCEDKYDFITIDTDEPISSIWRYRLCFTKPIYITPIDAE
jgi:hypothetical protein